MTLTVFRSTDPVFCGKSLNLGLFDCFVFWLTSLGDEGHRGEGIGCMLWIWLVTVDAYLDPLTEVMFVSLLPYGVAFLPFSILHTLEGSHCVQPTSWGGRTYAPLTWRPGVYIYYLEFSYMGFVSIVLNEYLFCTLACISVLHELFFCSNYSSFRPGELF